MKKSLITTVAVVLALISLIVAAFPFLSNCINSMNSDSTVQNYLVSSEGLNETDYKRLMTQAKAYNKSLSGKISDDPFSQSLHNSEYNRLLSLDESGVMATLEIPSLSLSLPVYHGTSDEALEKGLGHLFGSSLPVGGKGTHSVITGHTGFSVFRLFSDLDKLEKGDIFKIYVLGEILAYEVDNIATVLPEDTRLLQTDPDSDLVTLITCVPFGVNSHRLLVRGHRVSLNQVDMSNAESHIKKSTWNEEYTIAIIMGIGVMLLMVLVYEIIRLIKFLMGKRKNKNA